MVALKVMERLHIRGAYDRQVQGGRSCGAAMRGPSKSHPVLLSSVTPIFTQGEFTASKLPC